MVQDEVRATGFEGRKDRTIERTHVDRPHEAVMQIVIVLGNPEHVEFFRIFGRIQRRCQAHGDIRMSEGVGFDLGNALDDVGIFEQRARYACIDVTVRSDDGCEQSGKVARTGGIVGDFVAGLEPCKLQQ